MDYDVAALAHLVARLIETLGITVIAVGIAVATGGFVRHTLRRISFDETYYWYRTQLGRAILMGLEFLVAADIIRTVAVEPTFHGLGVLALIVVIRTFLSFTLEVEISGRWPWNSNVPPRRPDTSPR